MESLVLIILLTILVFFLLIGIHEWGHYYFARRAGILVREFAIGFGPKLFSYKKGETTFTVRLLPIGGFAQMAGEESEFFDLTPGQIVYFQNKNDCIIAIHTVRPDDVEVFRGEIVNYDFIDRLEIQYINMDGHHETRKVSREMVVYSKNRTTQIAPRDRLYTSKTVGQRALTIFAGPMMNFILAFLLFICVVYLLGVAENVKLAQLEPGMPAAQSGLMKGDIVLKINGQEIADDSRKLANAIDESLNQQMTWIVSRNGQQKEILVTPILSEGSPRVGVMLGADRRLPTFGEAITGAWDYTVHVTKLIFEGLKRLVLGQFAWEDLGGPVRTVSVTVEAAKAGFPNLVYWAAILSLYLGIFNLLPFPALDGSRLIFIAIEWVRGRPIEAKKENMVHFIGFAMLMGLMLVVTYHDIVRFFK